MPAVPRRGREAPGRQGARRGGRRATWRLAGLLAALGAMALVAAMAEPGHLVGRIRDGTSRLGAWGPVGFIALYTCATLVAIPGTPFTLAAPLIFGPWLGFAVMVVASSLSASAAFLIARHLARDAVARALA